MAPLYILLGLLLLHTTPWCLSAAVDEDTLMAGQSLAVGDKLVSRNGKSTLGFFQPAASSSISKSSRNATSSRSGWYLGIWFNKIPILTTVWIANREEPITHPNLNSAQLKISNDGNLAIVVNHGSNTQSIVWSTHIVNNRTHNSLNITSAAVLLNNGNLVLKESPSFDLPVWQSFDNPTDVWLAGVKFGRDKVTGFSCYGISKKSLIDPGLGSYSIELEGTRGIVLKHHNPSIEYWLYASSTASSLVPLVNSLLSLDPRTKGLYNLVYVNTDKEEYYMYTSHDESSSMFVSLDISGQIKLNLWSQANQAWQTIYAQPDDPCDPPAACGPFAVCRGKPHPSCDCMEGFSKKSPQDLESED
uniref:non-specific serine/threonine protein kinase n=1 Tax=Triticum urartu TaxID=4572 RepID=A0A8R7JUZ6_TRIUA